MFARVSREPVTHSTFFEWSLGEYCFYIGNGGEIVPILSTAQRTEDLSKDLVRLRTISYVAARPWWLRLRMLTLRFGVFFFYL